MAIDGDPAAVADVEAALYSFGQDDVPCLAVRVLCSRDASDFVVDLNDQLGRSVQRRFSTAAGAAAFVVSWARRPLPQDGTSLAQIAPPAAPAVPAMVRALAPPGAARVETPARPAGSLPALVDPSGRHIEVHAAYMPIAGNGGILEGALVQHRGVWQYGVAARAVATWPSVRHSLDDGSTESMWFLTEAEGVVRAQSTLDRLIVRGELAAGGGVLGLWTDIASAPYFQALGARGGVRAMLIASLTSSLHLEAVAGTEVMLAAYTTPLNNALARERFQMWPHVDIGLLWAP